jgi:hypothetical protein
MDTDGNDSEILLQQQHHLNSGGSMGSLLLSPTLLTKRHQQAIRVVEQRQWEQVQYLLSANPWLSEMTDVTTNICCTRWRFMMQDK